MWEVTNWKSERGGDVFKKWTTKGMNERNVNFQIQTPMRRSTTGLERLRGRPNKPWKRRQMKEKRGRAPDGVGVKKRDQKERSLLQLSLKAHGGTKG